MVCAWIRTTDAETVADSHVYLAKSATVTPKP
jgi:hypothetical protein